MRTKDEWLLNQTIDAVRNDYRNSDMTAKQIACKYGISIRTVFHWSEGINRKGIFARKYASMRFSSQDIDDLLIAVMEAEKSAKGDMLTRLNFLEDKLATASEELYARKNV